MAVDTASRCSRRALLAAALGAGIATVASALDRPGPATAADGGNVIIGQDNSATATTQITNTVNTNAVVFGSSSFGIGVRGQSDSSVGVAGFSQSSDGVFGVSNTGTAVHGFSGTTNVPNAPAKTGLYGYAAQDANARGVTGQTTAGRGVNGIATTGTGVYASATTGYALRAVGRVKLDKCAGVATIVSGTKSILVTPGIDLVSTSAVVATLLGSAGATTTVHRVSVSTTGDSFTIYLTANATQAVKVAWHVFG